MLLLVFQMIAGCCALFLLCCILNGTESSNPSLGIHKARYNNSFRLARSTRTRVQQLLSKYVSGEKPSQTATVPAHLNVYQKK